MSRTDLRRAAPASEAVNFYLWRKLGIDISHHRSKLADEFRDASFDLVVTVCNDAAEQCPVWLGSGRRMHIGFPDPARATGTPEERLAVFRQVRDAIRQKVLNYLSNWIAA